MAPARTLSNVGWSSLDVAVVGGGIGGLATAIAMRRSGHKVTIYERSDFAGEVGASVSCAANGTRWLHEWDVDIQKGDPVLLRKLINRNWNSGEPVSVYDLDDYEEKWGYIYWMVSDLIPSTTIELSLADFVVSPTRYARHADGQCSE